MNELKKHLSVEKQANLLISRGLIINDIEKTERLLSNVNYYRLSGYIHGFKDKKSGLYQQGTSIELVHTLYEFDRRFTRILMYALEDIEETLKTRISYCLSSSFPEDPLIYKKADIYKSEDEFNRFSDIFQKEVKNNQKVPFVKHHFEKYGGEIPIWVAVEIMTMGNMYAIYKNLLTPYRKKIAATYDTGPNQLESWIQNLTYTRNHLAHYMRIYDYSFGRTPAQCTKHHKYKIKSGKIFDQIYIMSFMYSDKEEWNQYVIPEMERLFLQYSGYIRLESLGFPAEWKYIIKKS